MADMMTFPDTVEEFMEEYKLVDTEQVYTNGTELVPIFRMEQWFEHEKTQLSREGTTSDLISRTETVEHLRRMLEATVPNTDYDEGYVDGVEFGISTVSTMPTIQPEPQWIPVSERLPKIGEYVLCYLKSRRYFGHYRVCIYRAADKYINHPYFDFNENGFPDVIAWMPLPEPYKPNK